MNEATRQYQAKKTEALELLKKITAGIKGNDKKNEKINWDHTGSMSHIVEELKDVAEFLNN